MQLTEYNFRGRSLVNDIFIETGTYRGETLRLATQAGYSELHSIEINEVNYTDVLKAFANYHQVHLHLGSSPDVLAQIIDRKRATTFWLDAHFLPSISPWGVGQRDKYGECPLLEELRIIFSSNWSILPYVLIDDAKMYTYKEWFQYKDGTFRAEDWPSLDQIKELLPKNYGTDIHNDIIYCIPLGD